MFPLAVALIIAGYGVAYWGALNVKGGGNGPSFGEVFGIKSPVTVEDSVNASQAVNLTGQPPTTADSPSGGVWT